MTTGQHGRIRCQARARGVLFASLEPRDQHGLACLESDLLDSSVAIDRDLLDLRPLALVAKRDGFDRLRDGVVIGD